MRMWAFSTPLETNDREHCKHLYGFSPAEATRQHEIISPSIHLYGFSLVEATRQHEIISSRIQETPQCDETRFSTLQPSIDMTGIRNERWQ